MILHTNLSSLGVGSEEVYDFNSGFQDFLFDTHLHELRSFSVDGRTFVGIDGAPLVNGLT